MPSSESFAVVFMPARSEPVPGSVIARAHISSPETNFGRKRFFCSSVASILMYGRPSSTCTPEPPKVTPARAVSSYITASNLYESMPAPPYSSSTRMPNMPSSASL